MPLGQSQRKLYNSLLSDILVVQVLHPLGILNLICEIVESTDDFSVFFSQCPAFPSNIKQQQIFQIWQKKVGSPQWVSPLWGTYSSSLVYSGCSLLTSENVYIVSYMDILSVFSRVLGLLQDAPP
jgi:hypothetical protein